MKTIRLILLACLAFAFSTSSAQLVKFGVKGGLNFPSINSTNGNVTFESKTGWHAGGMVQFNIPIVKVGADLMYTQDTYDVSSGETLKTSHFDIPVWGKLTLLKFITIHAGPLFSFNTDVKLEDVSLKDEWEHKSVRFFAGAGVALGPLDVHGRFIFPSTTTWQNSGEEIKNSNIQVSLGYWFGGKKD